MLGSVNTAIVVSKLMYGDDIRCHGSGNAGGTNMLRTYGKRAALLTLIGDVFKALLAVFCAACLVGFRYAGGFSLQYILYLTGFACIMGHAYPLYYGFRGGKGVLCTAAVVLLLAPFAFLVGVIIFAGTLWMTKYVSLASCLAMATFPLFYQALFRLFSHGMQPPFLITIFTLLIPLLVIYLHRSNISRLMHHTERKIGQKKHEDEQEPPHDPT